MVASWPKLQCVRVAVRPDVSRNAMSSSTASVLKSPVSMVRSSIRWRRARAASKSAWTLANRSSGGRVAHSRCAVYAVTADTLLPVIVVLLLAGPEGEWWERLQRRATWRGGRNGHSEDKRRLKDQQRVVKFNEHVCQSSMTVFGLLSLGTDFTCPVSASMR